MYTDLCVEHGSGSKLALAKMFERLGYGCIVWNRTVHGRPRARRRARSTRCACAAPPRGGGGGGLRRGRAVAERAAPGDADADRADGAAAAPMRQLTRVTLVLEGGRRAPTRSARASARARTTCAPRARRASGASRARAAPSTST